MKFNLAVSVFVACTVGEYGGVFAETVRGKRPERDLLAPPITQVGEFELGDGGFPLGRCKGDCDNDSQCHHFFHCFKREPGSIAEVPSCSGAGGPNDEPGKDYCTTRYEGAHELWLLKVGDDGVREDNGLNMTDDPLGKCEGDCDINEHCKPGLKCFQRSGHTLVPGCWNRGGDRGQDYCVNSTFIPEE